MSKLIYNGVELEFVTTRGYDRRAVLSEDSTEVLHERHLIDLTCYFTPGGPNNNPTGPIMDALIHSRLMAPRKRLELWVGNTLMLASPSGNGSCDLKNGPNPISCTINRIQGTSTLIVNYQIETWVSPCSSDDSGNDAYGDPVLSSRWTQAHNIDETKRTTITTRGSAIFRSDRLNAKRNADYYRDKVIPGLPLGFVRRDLNVTVSSDGLTLLYEAIDVEAHVGIGTEKYNVEKFDMSLTIASVAADGSGIPTGQVIARLQVRVFGSPTSSKANLLIFMYKMAIERLKIPSPELFNPNTDGTLRQAAIVDQYVTDRMMSIQIEQIYQGRTKGPAGFGPLRTDLLEGDTIEFLANNGRNPQMRDNNTRGDYNGLILTQAIRDSCTAKDLPTVIRPAPSGYKSDYLTGPTGTGAGGVSSASQDTSNPLTLQGAGFRSVSVSISDDLPQILNRYGNDYLRSGYNEYSVTTRIDQESGKYQCPVAGPPGTPSIVLTLSGGMSSMIVDWTAERRGRPPQLPSPDHSNENYELLHSQITTQNLVPAPDGITPVYRISGIYKYAMKRMPDPRDPIFLGVVPWNTMKYGESFIGYDAFTHGIIDHDVTGARPSY